MEKRLLNITRTEKGSISISCNTKDFDNNCDSPNFDNKCMRCNHATRIRFKCAAYEDTGYTPEEIAALRSENKRLRAGLDKAIEKMRNIGWCSGCKHFIGLKGCGLGCMDNCNDDNDLYAFFGLEESTCG